MAVRLDGDQVTLAKDALARGACTSIRDAAGWTPLGFAMNKDRPRCVDLLLPHATFDAVGDEEMTLLHIACRADGAMYVNKLVAHIDRLKNGAAVWKALLERPDARGWTALMHAAALSNDAAVEKLLSMGANPKPPGLHQGIDLLTLCLLGPVSGSNFESCARLLMPYAKKGADDIGLYLVHACSKPSGAEELMGELLKCEGVLANKGDAMVSLLVAAEQGSVECMKMLLSAHVDPWARNEEGSTALEYAMRCESRDTRFERAQALLRAMEKVASPARMASELSRVCGVVSGVVSNVDLEAKAWLEARVNALLEKIELSMDGPTEKSAKAKRPRAL